MNRTVKAAPRRPSVLIATDDPVAAAVLARRLGASGNRVRTVVTPGDLLMSVHREIPDLVVLQPGSGFSGSILYRRLRSHPATRDLPVLVVAPLSQLEAFDLKPEPGFFASKPVLLDVLAGRVERLLRILPLAPGRDLQAA
ncbi:MAG: Response regulator receiver domain [Chloroflexota bacterium]|nr:Response regulator receiver domain [Chloroflexota bacterium]